MAKLYINGVEYPLADGFLINDKLNEELDSGVITIPLINKLNLSPFDKVEITRDYSGTKHLLINTWNDTTTSFTPPKYNYSIALISETIKLQKIVCPDLAISQPIGLEQKTIWQKIQEYFEVYIKPQYPELYLSEALYYLTKDVICPENMFGRPTIFEVFNDLLVKVNAVVRVLNNAITYLKLDILGSEIDTSKVYYENDTQNINEYANRLDVQVSNAISDRNNYASISGITVRGGEEPLLTDDNMRIVLDKPIYEKSDISSIYAYFTAIDKNGTEGKVKADISEYVVPKSVYDTYLVSTKTGVVTEKNYKRNALYFNEGGKEILGLNYNEKAISDDSWIALYNILINKTNLIEGATIGFDEADIRDNVMFSVVYKTNDSFRLNLEKENNYNATLIDNQTETQVDAETFGLVEQDKLNRLGNSEKIITATYRKSDRIPQLGDYIGDYVLAEREIVYYDDYALFKGYLYKNFVRKNMFYGLNSKKRFTQIAQESVIRNDVDNYNVSFTFEEQPFNSMIYMSRYLLNPIAFSDYPQLILDGKDYNEFPKYCLLEFLDKNGNRTTGDNYILISPSTYATGKSNVIQFALPDNFSAGIKLGDNVTGGKLQQYVKYVDDYGEFKTIRYTLYSNKKEDFVESQSGADAIDMFKPIADQLPEITQTNLYSLPKNHLLGGEKLLYKDNRETIALSINFNFKNTNSNIIIGNFPNYTGLSRHYNLQPIYICYSEDYEYEQGDKMGIGTIVKDDTISIDYTDAVNWLENEIPFNKLSLYLDNVDTSKWKSWGIVTPNNELLLGVNRGGLSQIPTTIYIKIEKNSY